MLIFDTFYDRTGYFLPRLTNFYLLSYRFIIPYMFTVQKFFRIKFFNCFGDINGKIATQTQSGQQEKTCPLENSAQDKLIATRRLSALEGLREQGSFSYA